MNRNRYACQRDRGEPWRWWKTFWLSLYVVLWLAFTNPAQSFQTGLGICKRTSPWTYPIKIQAVSDPDASTTSNSVSKKNTIQKRRVITVQKFARYPVWPAWNGVLIWAVGKLMGDIAASQLEEAIGGRVGPNFFVENDALQRATSPFMLLVHHCHSFAAWDPLRWFQSRFILPEGFPSHPHRGFITLTYFLRGGFRHRDSVGVEQHYGVPDKQKENDTLNYPHSQWLNTGAGLLHEEMFDFSDSVFDNQNILQPKRHELYQIWINLPASQKLQQPSISLLSDGTDTPVLQEQNGQVQVRVLAGQYKAQHQATTPISTDMMILHVTLTGHGTRWSCPLNQLDMETCFLYLRKGSLECIEDENTSSSIPVHNIAVFSSTGETLELQVPNSCQQADFLLLAAVPIREPCVSRGSMVMNTEMEIDQAYRDYQAGYFGLPWDHKLSREEWKDHVQKYRSRY